MHPPREVHVHLLPELAPEQALSESAVVVVDVLRATTTMIHALAAGCRCVRPCAEVDEARLLADGMRAGKVLLAGERDCSPIPGFDLGNSPREYTSELCRDKVLVFTTTNGTRALLRAADAERILIAAFVNFSAICEQLRRENRPIHIICAGMKGSIALEDILLAGGLVDYLCQVFDAQLNDSARLAWDCFENHGALLLETLQLSEGGVKLSQLGYDEDIRAAAAVDRFNLVPELKRDPLRIEVGAVGIVERHWKR